MMVKLDDFKDIANFLVTDLPVNQEISSRTAINRYYYWVFLTYREATSRLIGVYSNEKSRLSDFWKDSSKTSEIHRIIYKLIEEYLSTYSSIFHQLRKLRNISDYDIDANIDQKDAIKARSMAEQLFKSVQQFEKSFKSDLEKCNEIKIIGLLSKK